MGSMFQSEITRPKRPVRSLASAAGPSGDASRLGDDWRSRIPRDLVALAEIPVGVDGEAVAMTTPVRCAIRPAALRVRVPVRRPGVPVPRVTILIYLLTGVLTAVAERADAGHVSVFALVGHDGRTGAGPLVRLPPLRAARRRRHLRPRRR